MQVEFADEKLAVLETSTAAGKNMAQEVVRAFRMRMQAIRAACNETDLYQFKSWRFEKLKGDRSHQRSIRLNDQWRLIVEIKQSRPKNVMLIVAIEDYH